MKDHSDELGALLGLFLWNAVASFCASLLQFHVCLWFLSRIAQCAISQVHKAQNVASKRGKLLTEDFLYLIRKDMRKLHRATELLSMNEELKQARKAFDVNEETLVVTNEWYLDDKL